MYNRYCETAHCPVDDRVVRLRCAGVGPVSKSVYVTAANANERQPIAGQRSAGPRFAPIVRESVVSGREWRTVLNDVVSFWSHRATCTNDTGGQRLADGRRSLAFGLHLCVGYVFLCTEFAAAIPMWADLLKKRFKCFASMTVVVLVVVNPFTLSTREVCVSKSY